MLYKHEIKIDLPRAKAAELFGNVDHPKHWQNMNHSHGIR